MPTSKIVELREFVTQAGPLNTNRESGYIRDVKVLGLKSANNRSYTPEAVNRAKPLYEGRLTNANHSKLERSAYDRLGWLEGVYTKPDGLYAKKWNILQAHPLAPAIMEAAER